MVYQLLWNLHHLVVVVAVVVMMLKLPRVHYYGKEFLRVAVPVVWAVFVLPPQFLLRDDRFCRDGGGGRRRRHHLSYHCQNYQWCLYSLARTEIDNVSN